MDLAWPHEPVGFSRPHFKSHLVNRVLDALRLSYLELYEIRV
jgi:hypothetical protein